MLFSILCYNINMKKYDFITIGGATEDITFHTREGLLIANRKDILRQKLMAFEYGAKVKIDRSNSTFGGGAANAAVSFSRLGFKAGALLAIGDDDRGKKIIKNLKKEKVDISMVHKIKGEESGYSFILTGSDNEHIVFSNRGANSQLSIINYQLSIFSNTKWLYITSLSGNWEDVLKKIFSVKKIPLTPSNSPNPLYQGGTFRGVNFPLLTKEGVGGGFPLIVWNPGHRQLEKGASALGKYLKNTSVLIVNKDEAIELVVSCEEHCHRPVKFLNNIKNLAEIIQEFGPKIVVITDGRRGAYAFDGSHFYFQSAAKEKKRINTTGVGDAFGSSFIAGLEIYPAPFEQSNCNNSIKEEGKRKELPKRCGVYKGDIKRAMNLAARNAASVVSHLGAQAGLLKKKNI